MILYEYVRRLAIANPDFDDLSSSEFNNLVNFTVQAMVEVLTFQNVRDMVKEEIGDDY